MVWWIWLSWLSVFSFGFVFRMSFALWCPFSAPFYSQSRSQWLAYVFCCYMDLLLPPFWHCLVLLRPRVVFNIICLSTCCGICSRQQAVPHTTCHRTQRQGRADTRTCTCFSVFFFLSQLPFLFYYTFSFIFFFLFLLASCLRFRLQQRCRCSLLSLSPSFLLELMLKLQAAYLWLCFPTFLFIVCF